MYICMYVHVCLYICNVYMYACMYVYMHIYMHIYMHFNDLQFSSIRPRSPPPKFGPGLRLWVLVTFARYLCIVRPMDVKWRNLRRMKIATIWLLVLSVLLNTPTILETLVRIYSYCNCAFNILEVRSSTC